MPGIDLRALLKSRLCSRFVGVHDGLSAALVQEAGFDGIWVSGLAVSTSYCVPDAGLLTMTEFLSAATQIRHACDLPIIADVDAGFGDLNVVQRMVRLYEAAGIQAVCIEDKVGQKRNSFRDGSQLADPDEFSARILVAKNAQRTPDFAVIARLESLIVGESMDEAIARAEKYHDAGADCLLIHSRAADLGQIREFAGRWHATGRELPLIAIPTTYYTATTAELTELGISAAIYANQLIRATTRIIRDTLESISEHGSSAGVEPRLDSLQRLFSLVGTDSVHGDKPWSGLAATGAGQNADG